MNTVAATVIAGVVIAASAATIVQVIRIGDSGAQATWAGIVANSPRLTRTCSSIAAMRFTYAEAMTDPAYYVPLAQAAEAAGYHAMTVADSIAYPFESDSKYPVHPRRQPRVPRRQGVHRGVRAAPRRCRAVTTTLRFDFFVLKLPIRPPALVAKQAGSLAALFGNRLGLGVGTSPWPEDYELLGVPFAKRGKRMDECIDIIRGLTSGEYFEYHGEFYDIAKTKMTARRPPSRSRSWSAATPTPRCAAPCASDGWMHGGGDAEELDRLLAEAHGDPRGGGRRPRRPFEIHVISMRRLHRRRHQAPRGQGRHRRASSASGCPTSWAPTPSRWTTRSATWRRYAKKVMSKV